MSDEPFYTPSPMRTHTFRCSDRDWEELERLAKRESVEAQEIVSVGDTIRRGLIRHRVAQHRRLDRAGVPPMREESA